MNPVLQTDTITLCFLTIFDADVLFQLVEKNRKHLGQWFPWVEETQSVGDVENVIREDIEKFENGEGVFFIIEYEGIPVGVISFNSIDKKNKSARIGYWLDKDHQGKGIMTES